MSKKPRKEVRTRIAKKSWRIIWLSMPDAWGYCDYERRIISLDTELAAPGMEDQLHNVLAHEITHAVDRELSELRAETMAAAQTMAFKRMGLTNTEGD